MKKNNVILIGFMGSGKTSVGKSLAERLSYHFKDTDKLLEQRVRDTISNIFAVHGEEYFRSLETELIRELREDMDHTVLSTGGGLPIREINSSILKDMGYVVYLRASKETTLKRLAKDTGRPLLQVDNQDKKIEDMLRIRTPIYESVAHEIVDTDDKSIDEIANLIMRSYRGL